MADLCHFTPVSCWISCHHSLCRQCYAWLHVDMD